LDNRAAGRQTKSPADRAFVLVAFCGLEQFIGIFNFFAGKPLPTNYFVGNILKNVTDKIVCR